MTAITVFIAVEINSLRMNQSQMDRNQGKASMKGTTVCWVLLRARQHWKLRLKGKC